MSSCNVTVSVQDELGTVEIVNSAFRVLECGYGSLEISLEPGVYKARASAAGASTEELFIVDAGVESLQVSLAPPRFDTPVPLIDSASSMPYQWEKLKRATGAYGDDIGLGYGGSIILCIRDSSATHIAQRDASPEVKARYLTSFEGFRLLSAEGKELLNFDDRDFQEMRSPDCGIMLINLSLAPGYYILRYQPDGGDPVDITVPVFNRWCSQLFFRLMFRCGLEALGYANVEDHALLLAPIGQRFDPASRSLRLTEIARYALIDDEYETVPDRIRQQVRLFSDENPVLGLLGAHLLLREAAPDYTLLNALAIQLVYRLGTDFPDVLALRIGLASLNGQTPDMPRHGLSFPPLLSASWKWIIQYPELLAPGSMARATALQVLPSQPWLAWEPVEESIERGFNAGELIEQGSTRLSAFYSMTAATLRSGLHIYSILSQPINFRRLAPQFHISLYLPIPTLVQWRSLQQGLRWPTLKLTTSHPIDDAAATLETVKALARILGTRTMYSHLKTTGAGQRFLKSLNTMQKVLLPVLLIIHSQLKQDKDFGRDHLEQLRQELEIPMELFRECVDDMLAKVGLLEERLKMEEPEAHRMHAPGLA
jgi:hypothetical protein